MWPPKKYIIAPKYQCPDCGDLHDDNYDAEMCCPVEVHKLYICPICDEGHMTEQEAIKCCDYDPEAPPRPLNAFQLEEIGQLPLIGMR